MSETLSGAQILCRTLVDEGVQYLFGYPGGAIMPFYHALGDAPELRHILVRHEQAAAHAAGGYARASGRVGVCVATSGPGAPYLLTGLATAPGVSDWPRAQARGGKRGSARLRASSPRPNARSSWSATG